VTVEVVAEAGGLKSEPTTFVLRNDGKRFGDELI
jgi:hypothetical protein